MKKKSILTEFKEFINRGSVVDLAVGVAIGGALNNIVKSLVDDIVMPIASLLGGGANIADLAIDIPNFFGGDTTAHIAYGNFLQNVLQFLIIAFVVFMVVKASNRLHEHTAHLKSKAEATKLKLDAKKQQDK